MKPKKASPKVTKPASWLELIWHVLRNPRLLATVVSIVFLAYIGARLAGYDILPPLLAKIGLDTYPRSVDITGKWKYRCVAIGTNYQHGGTCEISEKATPYGIEWRLSGHRRWFGASDGSGRANVTNLPTPYYWETQWGAITASRSVKFTYSITTADGTIEGYCYGDIQSVEKRPQVIIGKFFQLPPFKPLHGVLEFRRMSTDDDMNW